MRCAGNGAEERSLAGVNAERKSPAVVVINDCWNRIGVWGNQKPRCPELEKVIHCSNCNVYSSSGRMLLAREADPKYNTKWSGQLGAVKANYYQSSVSVVVFRIANEWLALPARLFQEVVHMRVFHRIPHAKSAVLKGIVNIRGELQLGVSLGRLLGVERGTGRGDDAALGIFDRQVVIADQDNRFVFPVSEVRGSHRFGMCVLRLVRATVDLGSAYYM